MADTATGWAVLLPIRKQHAANIYAGTKTMELRKTVPHLDGSYTAKYPFRVYLYESKTGGGAGAVTGYFSCPGFLGSRGGQYPGDLAQRAQVSEEYIREYANSGGFMAGKSQNPPACRSRWPCPPWALTVRPRVGATWGQTPAQF